MSRSWDKGCCEHEPHWSDDTWGDWLRSCPEVVCHWGRCVESVCPECGVMTSNGFGAMACPCDTMPAWHSRHHDGRNKPHPPVKARGRHGGRIAQSRKAHDKAEKFYLRLNGLLGNV